MEAVKGLNDGFNVPAAPIDNKIEAITLAPKSTIPAIEEGTDEVEAPSIPEEIRVEDEILPPKSWTERVNEELLRMDEMLLDPHCDPALKLQQAYRILDMLFRRAAKSEKEYTLDKEPLIWEDVKKLKGSFNTWTVLGTAVASGILTGAGGFLSIGSAVPGTKAGMGLAAAAPKLFQFFGNANNGKLLSTISGGVSGVGHSFDVFGKMFGNSDEAKRVVYNYVIEEGKRKMGDRQDAFRQDRDAGTGAINNCRSVAEAFHRAIEMFSRSQS